MIDDGALKSRKLGAVSLGAGELWFRILLLVDDNGNYPGDPLVLYVNGMRNKKCVTVEMVTEFLAELIEIGLLEKYEVQEEDLPYIHVVNFHDHQSFKNDRPVKVTYPIHPNGAYFNGTGIVPLRNQDGTVVDTKRKQDGPTPIPKRNPEVELELEVESKVEEEDEVGGSRSEDLEAEKQNPPFVAFRKEFRAYTGVRLKDFRNLVETYEAAVSRYGWETLCKAIETWVAEEGGRDVVKKNKYASKNFFEALDEIVEEFKNPPVPKKEAGGYPVFRGHDA